MAQVQEAAGQAQERAREATGEMRGKAREQVDQRTTEAGERVSATASDVRSVGEELRKQGKDGPARMADQVAERAERLGGYLRDSHPDRILGDVEDFGRRRPWAIAAGGLVLGFAASRFLKASSRDRYRASYRNGGLSDREAGGPTSSPPLAPGVPGVAPTGGAPGTPPGSGFEPHR